MIKRDLYIKQHGTWTSLCKKSNKEIRGLKLSHHANFPTRYPHSTFSLSKMDAPIECQVTRAKNVDQHPGLTGTTRKRHTREEIEHDKALLQEKKDVTTKKKH
jgi:hypothetical protein